MQQTPYSIMKIFHHPDILEKLERQERCAPLYVRIKPTNICNHNCYYCHYKNSYIDLDEYVPNDYIPRERMLKTIDEMAEIGVKAVTFSGGGEPLAYPYIEETFERVLENQIDLSIITNGSLLNGKKAELLKDAKWVRISLESVNEEEYCKVRGIKEGAFEKLCKNIQEFAKIKAKNCELGINFVISKENYMEIRQVAELMKSLGVNHVKFSPLISTTTNQYHAPFKDEVIQELGEMKEELQSDTFRIIDLYTADFEKAKEGFERTYRECPIKEFICILAANSKVYYCHDKAYISNGCIFDLNKVSFKEGWYSEETTKLFHDFDAKKICKQHCVYDQRNELINSFLTMDKNHVNFI